MSRREIVLLVSRAIGLLQIITALVDLLVFMPSQMLLMVERTQLLHSMPENMSRTPATMALQTLTFSFVPSLTRIVVLLIIGVAFWRCGPFVERLLLPAGSTEAPAE